MNWENLCRFSVHSLETQVNVNLIMLKEAKVAEQTVNAQTVEDSDDFSEKNVKQFKVTAIVSFEVELLVEAEDEDEAEEFANSELIHCDISTNTELRVDNDFAYVDVRCIEEVWSTYSTHEVMWVLFLFQSAKK